MDGWNTIVSFWDGLFSGAMLVLGRVYSGYNPLILAFHYLPTGHPSTQLHMSTGL